MGLYDFFDSEKWANIKAKELLFPNGDIDKTDGANELLSILNNRIDLNLARSIFVRIYITSTGTI